MLWRREMLRFFRQRNRVIGALGTPLVFWLVLGLGLNQVFVMPDDAGAPAVGAGEIGYLAYFFPGMIVLMVLFTAVFSTISVIEDRRAGFLQAVLVSPTPRLGIVLGQVLGGASIAGVQGVLLLLLWPMVGQWVGLGSMLAAAVLLFVIAIGLTGLGLCVGWSMTSTAGFHAVMNLVLMPMWLLSGAVFPLHSAGPLRYLMYANPLTYGYAAFASLLSPTDAPLTRMPLSLSLPIILSFVLLTVGLSTLIASRRPG